MSLILGCQLLLVFSVLLLYLVVVNGDYYQHSTVDSDVCDLEKIQSPSVSKIQCVLRCQRKKQAAVYKENKQCYCTNTECLQKSDRKTRKLSSSGNQTADTIFTKITGYPKFLLDFHTMSTNSPILPDKSFHITNSVSMTVWLKPHPKIEGTPNSNHLFTIPLDQNAQHSGIQSYLYDGTGPNFMFKDIVYRTHYEIPAEKWTHLCITVQQDDNGMFFKTYINGKFRSNEKKYSAGNALPSGEAYKGIVLGNDVDGDEINDPAQFVNGHVAEFYLFDSALRDEEVTEVYNHRVPLKNQMLSWNEFEGTANEVDVNTTKYFDEIHN